ncbi:histidine kinase dimerization/phosphoacceptor domain -containing protein [Spirochaeta cellobiosiphila]|uniref:histidine kinase dimerization/phosphoacceptor domain -containing protein n=1 Tax=Spirochaeta cellobiosiphila TaxID=504483 RepID=UPI00040B7A21|nr:histidine kinase dimerization/phosphoacceptor domain -containing protein [Spirochaeta cellobiosiphila]
MNGNLTYTDETLFPTQPDSSFWKVMISDDTPEVHAVTKLALKNFTFEDKPIRFLSAYSGSETIDLIKKNPDTALILLDVVMEHENTGLEVVKNIREQLDNHHIRIILRTGQPGFAPERKVIIEYDINDYREKTELTAQKLFTTITSALRSYRDILTIEKSRQGLAYIISEGNNLLKCKTLEDFSQISYQGILRYLTEKEGHRIVHSSVIHYINGVPQVAQDSLPNPMVLAQTQPMSFPFFKDNTYWDRLAVNDTDYLCYYFETSEVLTSTEQEILKTFSSSLKLNLDNLNLVSELEKSLKEKQIMLKEIHHRVKNNLQIISSLLNMQTDKLKNDNDKELFHESKSRILSMALVHEKLYQAPDLAGVDFKDYLITIIHELLYSYDQYGNIDVDIQAEPLILGVDAAIPCGLIVNEIITNAIKYAFKSQEQGVISVRLHSTCGETTLELWDNGVGFPEGFDTNQLDTLGLQLITLLSKQLEGTIDIESKKGVYFKLVFPSCKS